RARPRFYATRLQHSHKPRRRLLRKPMSDSMTTSAPYLITSFQGKMWSRSSIKASLLHQGGSLTHRPEVLSLSSRLLKFSSYSRRWRTMTHGHHRGAYNHSKPWAPRRVYYKWNAKKC